ncbi:MAG: proteasome subunit beta, partial [Actinomycetota bacterium]
MDPYVPFDRIPGAGLDATSFSGLLRRIRPEAMPALMADPSFTVPHATTILAIRYTEGVVVAGDRRATEGYTIAHRSIEKVFSTDESSAVAIAGAAGPAIEMV